MRVCAVCVQPHLIVCVCAVCVQPHLAVEDHDGVVEVMVFQGRLGSVELRQRRAAPGTEGVATCEALTHRCQDRTRCLSEYQHKGLVNNPSGRGHGPHTLCVCSIKLVCASRPMTSTKTGLCPCGFILRGLFLPDLHSCTYFCRKALLVPRWSRS